MNVDEILELICDRCHYPYTETQDQLDELFEACPIVAALQSLTNKKEARP